MADDVKQDVILRARGIIGGDKDTEAILGEMYDSQARFLMSDHPWNFALRRSDLSSAVEAVLTTSPEFDDVDPDSFLKMTGDKLLVTITPVGSVQINTPIGGGRLINIGASGISPYLKTKSKPLRWIKDRDGIDILPQFFRKEPDIGTYWMGPLNNGVDLELTFREGSEVSGFPMPHNCMKVLMVDDGNTSFDVRQNVIYTRKIGAETITWIEDMTDRQDVWSDSFLDVLAARITASCAYRITGSGTTSMALRQIAREKLAIAKARDSKEGSGHAVQVPSITYGSVAREQSDYGYF